MQRYERLAALAVLMFGLLSVGCVAQGNVDALREDNNALRTSNEQLRADLAQARSMVDMLRNAPARENPEMLAELERLQAANAAQREQFEKALAEARQRILELSKAGDGGAILPAELNEALVRLAAENPNLMTFDPAKGMIRVSSDLTFALGSTEVQPAAVPSLQKLAAILNGPSAAAFEIRIVGHTDDVPVTSAANRNKFEDNWGLSAFRAIAVMRKMVEFGVSPTKLAVVGHGEHRPVVANPPRAGGRAVGAPANRRVEIYIVKMPGASVAASPARPAPSGETPAREAPFVPK